MMSTRLLLLKAKNKKTIINGNCKLKLISVYLDLCLLTINDEIAHEVKDSSRHILRLLRQKL